MLVSRGQACWVLLSLALRSFSAKASGIWARGVLGLSSQMSDT